MAMVHSAFRRAVLFLSSAAVAGVGSASAEDVITVIGERPSYRASEVRSATKTDTPLRETPQSVSVITEDLIDDQAMRSMADVVRYAPGVTMGQGEGHRDAPTLRGNASTADFFVDGVRDDVQYFRDLYNAERIEILKGPNAMIFGRGGGGGVINRVTEWADFSPAREISVSAGYFDLRRAEADLGAVASDTLALRLNTFVEDSDSYRDFVELERFGVNPTATLRLSDVTQVRLGYERFEDERVVDRGAPSQNGRPFENGRSTYYGNPEQSFAEATVDAFDAQLEHAFASNLTLRSHARYAAYDKFYQNVFAGGPVQPNGAIALQAYNSGTDRQNVFSQTDLIWTTQTGAIGHTILVGLELGRQETDNTRSPNAAAGSVSASNPVSFTPVLFGAAPQINNRVTADLAALYVQDQIQLFDAWQVIVGARFDRFDLDFDDLRPADADAARTDEFVSPRLGLVYTPVEAASLYASYSVSRLPQSGDQFSSLSSETAALEPEEFENLEVGVKWDVTPELSLTAALYQLERTNTRAADPNNAGVTVLTGAQRSRGFELSVVGAVTPNWEVIGGYAYQDVEITRDTTAAPAGRAPALAPEHSASLWTHTRLTSRLGFGIGVIHQGESFASISNAVTLPSFTRADAALFYALTDSIEAQLNVENVFDETYWATSHNDNNITPGSPTAARLTLRARF